MLSLNDPLTDTDVLTELVEDLNSRLDETSAISAERAFNIGCLLSGLLVTVFSVLAWIFNHWITAVLVLVITSMLAAGVTIMLSMLVRSKNLPVTYKREIEPEIETLLNEYELTRTQFDHFAYEVLPEGAPLVKFLSKPSHQESWE